MAILWSGEDSSAEMALLRRPAGKRACFALSPTLLLAIKSGELLIKLRRQATFTLEMLRR